MFDDFSNQVDTAVNLNNQNANNSGSEINHDKSPTTSDSSSKSAEPINNSVVEDGSVRSQGMANSGSLGPGESGTFDFAGKPRPSSLNGPDTQASDDRTGSAGQHHSSGRAVGDGITSVSRSQPVPELNDFRLELSHGIGDGGAKAKFKSNIEALKLLEILGNEERNPTAEEKQVLVKYVGWGGISQAFDPNNADWQKEYLQLVEVLPAQKYESARRSTQDAHYTPIEIIDGVYAGLSRLGFKGGRILEPAAGTGNFIGRMPLDMLKASEISGVELDDVTAAIAKLLYPKQSIINKGFQELLVPDNYFDAAIGNPPFGEQKVFDVAHQDLSKFSIHNYFLAKSVSKLAPGGIGAFVVSSYFMDAAQSDAREFIADQSHFLGAIRLPNSAFKQIAATEVVTDIVFFQKAEPGVTTERSWVTAGTHTQFGAKDFSVNRYFLENPDMVLGDFVLDSAKFGREIVSVKALPNSELGQLIQEAVKNLPDNVCGDRTSRVDLSPSTIQVPDHVKVGAYFALPDGTVAMRLPDILEDRDAKNVVFKNKRAVERVRGMIEVRDHLRELMNLERSPLEDLDLAISRRRLNMKYDHFVKNFGYVSSQANRLVMGDDPDYPLLQSLERDYDKGISEEIARRDGVTPRPASAKKASIFEKRVCSPVRRIESVSTAKEALVVSMNETGRVDWGVMRKVYTKSSVEMIAELGGLIFKSPSTDNWVTRDNYLSGNVKAKLDEASKAAELDESFKRNVTALQEVIPADIEPVDISVQLGSTWVPPEVVSEFVRHLLGDVSQSINYQKAIGKWVVKISGGDPTITKVQWGTSSASACELIESILLNRPIQVQDVVGYENGHPIYKTNVEKTAVANMKAEEIKQAFVDWIWDDETRRLTLGKLYNDRFNTDVPPIYDGSHLTLPGASLAVQLRPSQKNFIWRAIQDGTGLADHEVGAGKTFALCGVAMESRRMGLMRKPMLVVPNHLIGPWKDAFYAMYPDANVLVAEKEDFKKENRQKLFARIATGDWDAVIVAHSSFKKIGMPEETLNQILNEQIDDLSNAILQLKNERGDRVSIKEMEKVKDRMAAKLERASQTGSKDQVVSFADLGVDGLLLDEADEFKNLFITTSLSRISGLGNIQGSEKAFDLFVKVRYLQQANNNRGVIFATGTPIANSIAELYTMQRYLQYDELKKKNIHHFDAWASTFGQIVTGWELDATGVNYKMNSRFAKFQNVPELVNMYRSFADVITNADLIRQAQEAGKRFPLPKIKGGKPTNIIVERSPLQASFMGVREIVYSDDGIPLVDGDGLPVTNWNQGSIIYRMENMPKDPRIDNPLKVTNDARKAGLDYRLINPGAADFDDSKTNAMIDEAVRIYKTWDEKKGTQLIFCDLSTPKSPFKKQVAPTNGKDLDSEDELETVEFSMDELLATNASSKFNVYDDIRGKLIDRGVLPEQIAYIHDAKNEAQLQRLYDEMNRGDKRFLLGSTQKMGAGTNVQRRLVGEHHIDCPWRPRDLTQRMGRILRQGNELYEADPDGFEVEILRYSTKQMYDARMWQVIEYKAGAIEQFRRGDILTRVIDDVASEAASAAEMKAAATGNVLIFAQVQIQTELKKMEAAYSNFKRNVYALERRVSDLSNVEERFQIDFEKLNKEIQRASAGRDKVLISKDEEINFENKEKLGQHMNTAIAKAIRFPRNELRDDIVDIQVGVYKGFSITCHCSSLSGEPVIVFALFGEQKHTSPNLVYDKNDNFSTSGFFQRVDNILNSFQGKLIAEEEKLKEDLASRERTKIELLKKFPQASLLDDLRKDYAEVMVELKRKQADDKYFSEWSPRTITLPKETREEVVLSEGELLALAAKRIKSDYMHVEMHRPDADRIFSNDVHARINSEPSIRALVMDQIYDDVAFARVIADRSINGPMPPELKAMADSVVSDRDFLKGAATSAKLTSLTAKRGMQFYAGNVVSICGDHLLQDTGHGVGVVHRMDLVPGLSGSRIGDNVRIQYEGNKGKLLSVPHKDMAHSL